MKKRSIVSDALIIVAAIGLVLIIKQKYDNGDANSRYAIYGDTVYDKKTNLTWARCSVGQHWEYSIGCVGTIKRFNFNQAQQQAYGEWRVPTEKELATLIVENRVEQNLKPVIDVVAFPNMDMDKLVYWSSVPMASLHAWDVSFASGRVSYYYRSDVHAVRLVRSGH